MGRVWLLLLAAVFTISVLLAGCSSTEQRQVRTKGETEEQPLQYVIEDYVAGSGEEAGDGIMPEVPVVLDSIKWFGHASFMFTDAASGNRVYYVDPHEFRSGSYEKADIIFITHAHFDHCDSDAVKKIVKTGTVIAVPSGCKEKLGVKAEFVDVVPNKSYDLKGFKFRTVPAYNIKPDRLQYHPKSNSWVGYIFSLSNQSVYHAGDTDFIEEMKQLGRINVAMLPIGGTYTMDVDEAVVAANIIKADITVPIHYRRLLGSNYKSAEEKFKAGITKSKVVILDEIA